MDLIDHLRALSSRATDQVSRIETEEATKNALVMPFIRALGYDVFDPIEVVPEFTADVGVKKGEKVDYAIMTDGQPIMLFECKTCGVELDRSHASQLYRYFSVTKARVAVLTNGVQYHFYSDLDETNKMDDKAFLEFNVLDIQEPVVAELKKLTKGQFNIDEIMTTAGLLKYTKEIKRALGEQLRSPDENFVRLFTGLVYGGRFTKSVKEQFTEITRQAFREFVNERVNDRLKSALSAQEGEESEEAGQDHEVGQAGEVEADPKYGTTEEETEGFHIVKAILRKIVSPERIRMRDVATYCGIILDDNNRKPLARLWFNGSKKYLGLFDQDKKEERILLERIDDIYQHAERLRATVALYE